MCVNLETLSFPTALRAVKTVFSDYQVILLVSILLTYQSKALIPPLSLYLLHVIRNFKSTKKLKTLILV